MEQLDEVSSLALPKVAMTDRQNEVVQIKKTKPASGSPGKMKIAELSQPVGVERKKS
jgi:hypothetical protein